MKHIFRYLILSLCLYSQFSYSSYTTELQFRALFFQPTASNVSYAAEAISVPQPSPNWKIFDVDTDLHFGFDLGGSIMCDNSNTNVSLHWQHFKSCDVSCHTALEQNIVGPLFEIGQSPYNKARGKVQFSFDEVSLDAGYSTYIGDCLSAQLFAGINFARIEQCLSSQFTNQNNTISRAITMPSTFLGAGPQCGVCFGYDLWSKLQLTGKTVISALVGKAKNHSTYQSVAPELRFLSITPPNTQTVCQQDRMQVVPVIEQSLGLSYDCALCTDYMLNIEVGYEAKIFFNAIQSVAIGSEVDTPPILPNTIGVFARTFKRTVSNFALAGPYFSFCLMF